MTGTGGRDTLPVPIRTGYMMTDLPDDLIVLPTMPYDERPAELPLDIEECRSAVWHCRGNISEAAKMLKVPASRFRAFVKKSPRLVAEVEEAREQLLDTAEDIVYEALTDEEDSGRRDQMARFVLSNTGKSRGYGTGNAAVNVSLPKGNFKIQWADGSSLSAESESNGDDAKVINHE